MARSIPTGLVRDLPVRLAAMQRAALLGIDDPELLALIDAEVSRAYSAVGRSIPVRTGTLKRALTDPTSDRRKIVRSPSGEITVQIDHPGAYYIPAKVLPAGVDLKGAISRALAEYFKRQLANPRRTPTLAGRLLGRVIGSPFGVGR